MPYMRSTFNGHSMMPQCEYTLQRVHNQSSWTSTLNEVPVSSQTDSLTQSAVQLYSSCLQLSAQLFSVVIEFFLFPMLFVS